MDAVLLKVIAESIRSVSKRTETRMIMPTTILVEDLALDSLDLVSLLMKLEEHFGLSIELDEVGNIRTVADLGAHIDSLRAVDASAA